MGYTAGYSAWRVLASDVGTMIEWYDFHIFGSLAAFLVGSLFLKETHGHKIWDESKV
jgi:hypothetical protein